MTAQSKLIKYAEDSRRIPAKVTRAVIRQLGGWDDDTPQTLRDITRGGINGGFHGFIYYSETVPFARKLRAELLAMLESFASDMGSKGGAPEAISQFQCVSLTAGEVARALYARNDDNATEVFNVLAWYAGEEVARAFDDMENE